MLEELASALDVLAATELDTLTDGELHDAVVASERLSSALAAQRARLVQAWDARRVWASDGSKSPSARLARECRLAAPASRAEVHRAKALRSMPGTSASFAAGDISVDHVAVLIAANRPEFAAVFSRDEELLVEQATTMPFPWFRKAVAYWRLRADATLTEEGADRQREGRFLDLARTFNDMVDIRGLLDPVNGTIVMNELRRLEDQLFKADWKAAQREHDDEIRVDYLSRTARQRRADALTEMARRSAALTADHHPARPLISVLVGYETFAGPICELADGTVVTPGQVVPLLTEADIERVVFDPRSRDITDIGQHQRFYTGALRRVLEVRDRGCTFPGCDEPVERCEGDHITPWSQGGRTTLANGRLYCGYHNKQRNQGRDADRREQPSGRGP